MVQPQPGNQISRNPQSNQIAIRDLQKKVIEPQKEFIAAAMPKHMQGDVLDWLAAASLVIRNDPCILSTSDAAEDMQCVSRGCRPIIKKKRGNQQNATQHKPLHE